MVRILPASSDVKGGSKPRRPPNNHPQTAEEYAMEKRFNRSLGVIVLNVT